MRLRTEFVDGERGRLFTLTRAPSAKPRDTVLVIPPFAEEMNKSRRMVASTTAALAESGVGSICVDLHGTGDSDGEFAEASWDLWIRDLDAVAQRSAERGAPVTRLLATRLGCQLAAAYLRHRKTSVTRCVFWQPVAEGARYIDQFLRLRLASSLLGDTSKETLSGLREKLRTAGTLEVGGYGLSSGLAQSIGELRLVELLGDVPVSIDWIDVVRSLDAATPAVSAQCAQALRASGREVRAARIVGEPFWASVEIVLLPELCALTVKLLGADP